MHHCIFLIHSRIQLVTIVAVVIPSGELGVRPCDDLPDLSGAMVISQSPGLHIQLYTDADLLQLSELVLLQISGGGENQPQLY